MVSDFNTVFGRAWFGPFGIPRLPVRERHGHASPVYDIGPLDGLKTASMWAHQMTARAHMGNARLAQNPQPCPPGQVGYQTPGGIKCTAAPSQMINAYGTNPAVPNRRTFEVGPWWANKGLGDGEVTTLTPPEREALMASINAAMEKVPALDDLISYSGDYDRNLARTLGLDATRFLALSNSIAPLFPTVREVLDRLYEPEPALWIIPTAAEAAAVRQWTVGVSEMYKIFLIHKDKPLQLPLDTPAPPGFTNTASPTTPTVITRPAATPPASDVFSTQNLLLGGGLAVGVGLLIYTIATA